MLKYKGFELKEEDIVTEGTELLIAVENISAMKDEDFEILLWQTVNFSDKLYVEYQYDNYFEIRSSEDFTFDEKGVNALRFVWNAVSRNLKDKADITIGVFTGQFVFKGENGKTYNQDDVTLDEFEKSIELS